jgi:hypothetical protein
MLVGFRVMVLFLWSSGLDKHNFANSEWEESSVQKCLLSIFVEQTPLTADHQEQKTLSPSCVYN